MDHGRGTTTDLGDADVITIVAHDVGGVGGMERQLEALIGRLLEHGATVDVCSRTLETPRHPRLSWHHIPGPSRPFVIAYPWFALAATLMLVRRKRGVLHTTGAIVFNRADVCTVHYVHNGRSRTIKRMQRPNHAYRINAFLAGAISRLTERIVYSTPSLSRNLVAVSGSLATELRNGFPSRVAEIHVIGNGVDMRQFRPDEAARRDVRAALAIGDREPLALFVGSEWRRKGLEIAISALARADKWHLLVVGNGDAEEAVRQAHALGVEARVHLVRETTEPERYYAAADVLVLPSAYESFSLAAFEAAAAGLPIVATDVGAVAEIVNAGGGLFIGRNPASLADALGSLEADPSAASVMGARAATVALRFDWDRVVEEYVRLYHRSGRGAVPASTSSAATG
jgi:glycosyltransferase involved in cell wall biosynthesis